MNKQEKIEQLEKAAEDMLKNRTAYTPEGRKEYQKLLDEVTALRMEPEQEQPKQQDAIARLKQEAHNARVEKLHNAKPGSTFKMLKQNIKIKKLQSGLFNVYEGTHKILSNVRLSTVAREYL